MERTITIQDVRVPTFLYGTAWKEERTAELTRAALDAGFRGIDTANQRKHYHEVGVGEGLNAANVERSALFLQTKFTYQRGQDHRLPYDPRAPTEEQVRQSVQSSLEHLHTNTLDAVLLHGPETAEGLTENDGAVWRTLEALRDAGAVRLIGVSNMSAAQLEQLCAEARTPPAFIQNRCYARRGWDAQTRAVCAAHGVVYQGFSLLTANVEHLRSATFQSLVQRVGRSPAQIVFRAALQMGMIPLTGTTDAAHMRQDLEIYDFELSPEDVEVVEQIATSA